MISEIEDLGSLERFIEPWRFRVHLHVSACCSGFTATMDLPMNLFAPAMAERRPSSKVILTVRPLSSDLNCFLFAIREFLLLQFFCSQFCRPEEEWLSSWANVNDIMSFLVARPWSWLVDMTFNQQLLKANFRLCLLNCCGVYMSSICSSVV